jgi:hypothetical protein
MHSIFSQLEAAVVWMDGGVVVAPAGVAGVGDVVGVSREPWGTKALVWMPSSM